MTISRDETASILKQLGDELRAVRLTLAGIEEENRAELRRKLGLERSGREWFGRASIGSLEGDATSQEQTFSSQALAPRPALRLMGRERNTERAS